MTKARTAMAALLLCGGTMLTTYAGVNDGLLAYYPFDTDLADASGHPAANLVNHGGVVQSGGVRNACLYLDLSKYAESSAVNITQLPCTLAFWVKKTNTGGSKIIHNWGYGGAGSSGHYRGFTTANDSPYPLEVNADGPSAFTVMQLPLNTWTHLAAIYTGAGIDVFVNGQPQLHIDRAQTVGPALLYLGHVYDWWDNFSGWLDEVRVYNRSLSASEMQELYTGQPVKKTLSGISITGDTTVPAGGTRQYTCTATFSDGTTSNVTTYAQWSMSYNGVDRLTSGGRLTAGPTPLQHKEVLTAKYTYGSVTKASSFTVTVSGVLTVTFDMTEATWYPIGRRWSAEFTALSDGPSGEATDYSWDTDGDGAVGDVHGNPLQMVNSFEGGRTYLMRVEATDAAFSIATASRYITLDRPPIFGEPDTPQIANVETSAYYNAKGQPFAFDPSKTTNGLIIIVHGMYDFGTNTWLNEMSVAMNSALGAATPNIMQFDWREMSDPDLFNGGTPDMQWESDIDFLEDMTTIKPYAKAQSCILADWIRRNIQLGNIDPSAPIQIIGHSAGGFVATDCALALGPSIVDQISLLDTPVPDDSAISAYANRGGKAELFISSEYGTWGNSTESDPDNGLYEKDLNDPYWKYGVEDHAYAHEWFTQTAKDHDIFWDGFTQSPFLSPDTFHGTPRSSQGACRLLASGRPAVSALTVSPVTNFVTFGNVVDTSGVYTITEDSNAGMFKAMTMPVGATVLGFEYRFLSPGDGDQMAATWGTNSVLYIGLDTPLSRSTNVEVSVDLQGLDACTNNLVFKLLSRGASNAVVQITGITLGVSDDPDMDGLTTTQELSIGTNPLARDSDGDGIIDYDEVNVHHTNALLSDSDGDGATDGSELQAGTSATNALDCLRITALDAPSAGSVNITWSSVTGKQYRVNRASSVLSVHHDYETLTNGVSATPPTNTFVDVSTTNAVPRFYWIETE